VIRSGVEQGDADQDGLKIELASAPASRAGKVEIVQPRNEPKKAKARWAVQVGAFKSKSDAGKQIALVEKRFGDHFDGARGAADKQGRRYNAVFTGFSETDAKGACKALKAKRLACMVIAPA
jgi:D-alanyl-D-alanine carboxypeptidase (penicillin-binding protein 5/6)